MSVQEINIKTQHITLSMILSIGGFDPNNIKIDEKSYRNTLIYYVGYVTIKRDLRIYSLNHFYLIFDKMNVYFELINGNKQLTPVSINESKEKIKKNEERWIKTRDLVRSITKNLDDYDEKYDSDDNLPLNKTIEIPIVTIVVRAVLYENNKYYPQIFFR